MSKESRQKRQLSFYQRRMERAKEYLGGECVECGTDALSLLEFDHIDPAEKEFNITRRWSIKWERLRRELDKCELRCHSCHSDRTIEQGIRVTDGRPGAEHLNRQMERRQ